MTDRFWKHSGLWGANISYDSDIQLISIVGPFLYSWYVEMGEEKRNQVRLDSSSSSIPAKAK